MALNICNAEANRLAAEVAHLAGETKTDAMIQALRERLERLDQIALRCAARPVKDQRSADAICSYDATGIPS